MHKRKQMEQKLFESIFFFSVNQNACEVPRFNWILSTLKYNFSWPGSTPSIKICCCFKYHKNLHEAILQIRAESLACLADKTGDKISWVCRTSVQSCFKVHCCQSSRVMHGQRNKLRKQPEMSDWNFRLAVWRCQIQIEKQVFDEEWIFQICGF